ncbi:ArsR/SmtB family transcription factor [Mycoplasma crocodyli]|uniref:Predicted ArsR-family transcription repressor n=1 Tax=Mycoplasma crocodyli (strain ATCC 51981 / MP145) TaxID=512564 RepID=D5E5R1_MYCCM|nr:helix-turn-helix domain-containing protein [Mycoplasma crocodyli]ADE19885.1 predicted ArsR-family transcription repressor [Mycoplasma crocodyli MP145]
MKLNNFFKLCSSDVKLKIMIHLYSCDKNECDVNEFVRLFNEKQANISKHFMDLRKNKVVTTKKTAQNVFYKMSNTFKNQFNDYLHLMSHDHCYKDFSCSCSSITNNEDQHCVHDCCVEK